MPTYDYRCTACGARFEAWQKFTDEPIRVCPTCSGPAQRVIHAPAITFKGSGFYITDSKASGAAPAAVIPGETAASDGATPKAGETAKAAESAPSAPASSEPAKPAATPAKSASAPPATAS